jgi:hypothetical protein
LNHLLYWIARRAKGQAPEKIKSGSVYWYGSNADICAGLDSSWSLWKVRKEIRALVDSGLIGQRHNSALGFDREYQYFFGEEQGKVLKDLCSQYGINLLELGLGADVLHLLKTAHAFAENNTCIGRKQQMHVLNSSDPSAENSEAIPKVITKIPPKETTKAFTKKESGSPPKDVADATMLSQSSLFETGASFETNLATSGTQEQRQSSTPKSPSGKTPISSIEGQPQGKPEMPGDDVPWGPEKMVRLTECLRFCRGEQGVFFSTVSTGFSQKSQRDRQLVAAKKILASLPTLTQDEYVLAYSEQNNEWWNREKGSLTVEDMAANTPRKVMRTIELLEKVRSRSQSIKRPGMSPVETKSNPSTPPMTHDEACQLADRAVKAAKDLGRDIQAQVISLENDAWGIVVRWNTQYFEKPEMIKSKTRWESAMKAMAEVWQIEEKERVKRAKNG